MREPVKWVGGVVAAGAVLVALAGCGGGAPPVASASTVAASSPSPSPAAQPVAPVAPVDAAAVAALKAANGVLGTEYDYLKGPVLLRVTGQIKPSSAKAYQAALG